MPELALEVSVSQQSLHYKQSWSEATAGDQAGNQTHAQVSQSVTLLEGPLHHSGRPTEDTLQNIKKHFLFKATF